MEPLLADFSPKPLDLRHIQGLRHLSLNAPVFFPAADNVQFSLLGLVDLYDRRKSNKNVLLNLFNLLE